MAPSNDGSKQSKGGKARAESLTKEERSQQSSKAASARWAARSTEGVPHAIREAPLIIGNVEFECAVLSDSQNTRVISERAFSRAIGAKRGGSHWLRQKADPSGAKLPVFLSANNLKPFISLELAAALSLPTTYITARGSKAFGIRAELIPKILEVWLKASDADKLTVPQERFGKIADVLMRGLATTGIIALIDEATGFQNDRPADALSKILEAYVTQELRRWVPTFPVSFFRQLCRLKGIPFPEDMKLPRYFGHFVNDLVWSRLAPGVLTELRRLNPVAPETGRRKSKHFQRLTLDVGNPHLLHHLGMLEGFSLQFKEGEYEAYRAYVDKLLPKWPKFKTLWSSDEDPPEPPKMLLAAPKP